MLAALALPGVSREFAARLSAEDWEDIAAGDISVELVRAFEQVGLRRLAEAKKQAENRNARMEKGHER